MARWEELEAAAPALAASGRSRLLIPPAYLATIRADGRPGVHPVTPTIGSGRDVELPENPLWRAG
jgi:hypothetical protein